MSLRTQFLTQIRRAVEALQADYPYVAPETMLVLQELDGWVALLTRYVVPPQAEHERQHAAVNTQMVQLAVMHNEIPGVAERIVAIEALIERAKP